MATPAIRPPMQVAVSYSTAWCFPVLGVISSIILLYAMIHGWKAYQRSLRLQASGVAMVTWTDTGETCDDSSCRTFYSVDYEWIAPDGERYRGSDAVGENTYTSTQKGDPWPVRYDPENPADFQSEYTYRSPNQVVAGIQGKVTILVIIPGIFLLFAFPEWYKQQQFMRQSQVTQGIITHFWHDVTKDSDGGQHIQHWMAYTFPGGQETQQAITGHQYFHLDLGDTIFIRYLPKQPHCSQVEWKRTLTEKSRRLAAPQLER